MTGTTITLNLMEAHNKKVQAHHEILHGRIDRKGLTAMNMKSPTFIRAMLSLMEPEGSVVASLIP
jgi:hypothetical protein